MSFRPQLSKPVFSLVLVQFMYLFSPQNINFFVHADTFFFKKSHKFGLHEVHKLWLTYSFIKTKAEDSLQEYVRY